MNSDNLVLQIKTSYNQFTKAERKIADYVLENPHKVIYMSITDLADACEVGDASVYRFCRTMKLEGYQEFKMKLSLNQNENNHLYKGLSNLTDSLHNMAEQVMQLHISAIRETNMLLDKDNFSKMLEMIESADKIHFFGIGDSILTAQEARNKFMRITGKVSCLTDPHMQSMAASICSEKDLIIIISYSGATKDNIHVAKVAKEAGARIGCITHFKKSPLTAYCDAILLCGSEEAPLDGGSMQGKISQLYLIDLLFQEYYKKNFSVCSQNNKTTSKSVVEKLF